MYSVCVHAFSEVHVGISPSGSTYVDLWIWAIPPFELTDKSHALQDSSLGFSFSLGFTVLDGAWNRSLPCLLSVPVSRGMTILDCDSEGNRFELESPNFDVHTACALFALT